MKVTHNVPKHQRSTRKYMKDLPEVEKTLQGIIKSLKLMAQGFDALSCDFPPETAKNKAFDGFHHECKELREVCKKATTLRLRVHRGFIAQEMGTDIESIVRKQLDKSDCFRVGFVPSNDVRKLLGASSFYADGFMFNINRDGTLCVGVSSLVGF